MHYTIYEITNTINTKKYIGMHKTNNLDDGYMGSGKLIKRAIKKYGLDKFKKKILFDFDNEPDMLAKEAELVTEEFCIDNYNLCAGGKGGFGYINANDKGSNKERSSKGGKKGGKVMIERFRALGVDPFYGKGDKTGIKHSEETRKKLSDANSKLLTCPHCDKVGKIAIMRRMHFEKCKSLKA